MMSMYVYSKNLILILILIFLIGCSSVYSLDKNEVQPYLVLAENQNNCFGIPVVELIYPGSFRNETHSFTLFQIESGNKLIFETYLFRFSNSSASHLCLNNNMLSGSSIYIGYGASACGGAIFNFYLNDFTALKKGEKSYLELSTRKKEGGDEYRENAGNHDC